MPFYRQVGGIYMYPIDYLIKICTAVDNLMKTTVFYFSPVLPVTLEDVFLGTSSIAIIYSVIAKIYE